MITTRSWLGISSPDWFIYSDTPQIVNRYYRKFNKFRNDRWVFGDPQTGAYLPKPAWTEIERLASLPHSGHRTQ
jgi:hypothetical protein